MSYNQYSIDFLAFRQKKRDLSSCKHSKDHFMLVTTICTIHNRSIPHESEVTEP
jgi:hypothetical protein